MAEPVIRDNQEAHRFEAHVDGQLAGFAAYMLASKRIVFTHTEIDPQFEGQGVGSVLVRAALDTVRADGSRKVMPVCPFVKAWIQRHPDYQSLLFVPKPSSVTD